MTAECAAIVFDCGTIALIDVADVVLVSGHRWYLHETLRKKRVWVSARVERGVQNTLHKFLMQPPDGLVVDHINRQPLDNRRHNLRLATPAENSRNMFRRSDAYKGVCWSKSIGKWIAYIGKDRKRTSLGAYVDAREAAMAYDRAALMLHGEFAALNFPVAPKEEAPVIVVRVPAFTRERHITRVHKRKANR